MNLAACLVTLHFVCSNARLTCCVARDNLELIDLYRTVPTSALVSLGSVYDSGTCTALPLRSICY
jgi:hypothetical protein